MSEEKLCAFSKPILGDWCRCSQARLAEHCSGKMNCGADTSVWRECENLSQILRQNSRFVFGLSQLENNLTHQQMMKIRCGGLLGMQKVLGKYNGEPFVVREIVGDTFMRYGRLENFPYSEIMPFIKAFSLREKQRKR